MLQKIRNLSFRIVNHKKLKAPERVQSKPSELRGEKCTREGCYAVVYIGNGAHAQSYGTLFKENHLEGEALSGIGGKADQCAIHYCPLGEPFPTLINGFTHEEGNLLGFAIRRKKEGRWQWYCIDGNWHVIEADMPEKQVFQAGVRPAFAQDETEAFICEAQWISANGGQVIHCGYKMFNNTLMGHSFGGMNGHSYHNTIPAYKNGIRRGYRYFEVDISMTVDGRMVLSHGWTQSNCSHTGITYQPDFPKGMTYSRLMKLRVHGNKMIDARRFYSYIKKNPQHFFEIDLHRVKGGPAAKRIRALLRDFRYDPEVLDRLLIQAYSREMYQAIDEKWHFKNYQLLIGKAVHQLDDLITFMMDEGICASAMRVSLAKPECVRKLRNAGIYVLAYTVKRDVVTAKTLLASGVNTICTDYLTEADLQSDQLPMGHHPFYVYYHCSEPQVEHFYVAPEYEEDALVRTKAGNLEYQDPVIWNNDEKRQLTKCRFRVPGKHFMGWNLRMKADDSWYWYCEDGFYYASGDFGYNPKGYPHLFHDQEILPKMTVRENARIVMVSVWETADEKGITTDEPYK